MLTRRVLLSAPLVALPLAVRAQDGFGAFVASVRAEAVAAGVRGSVVDAAFEGVVPNAKVIELDHHQPEFELTWPQYRARVLPQTRLDKARAVYAREAGKLASVTERYRCDPRIVMGIWGLESNFGERTGTYRVVEGLATLAFKGRRREYFRKELINALRILEAGDVSPRAMTGSWAGAMGQPQFMPSSYLEYAVDADGDGRRDIWTDRADVFGSVANYFVKCGWRWGEPWGQPVQMPRSLSAAETGVERQRTLAEWQGLGVRRADGTAFTRKDVRGAILLPDGAGGDAFMVYHNFSVIRRYNSPVFYALGVGLLANAVA